MICYDAGFGASLFIFNATVLEQNGLLVDLIHSHPAVCPGLLAVSLCTKTLQLPPTEEGRKEGREEGRKEGRKGGRKGGRKEGRKGCV